MSSSFNPQILVEKLAKLNSSQTSIETKHVVETWDRQFHCSPREQRMAFLYLANDILQNSRRKGADFVAEFWRVLPDALRDTVQNGGISGRNEALRLINIWDERKVFGSRGHMLKDEFLGRQPENNSKAAKSPSLKLKQSVGSSLDKIISDYEVIYCGQLDEDAILSQCRNTITSVEKVTNDVNSNTSSGQFNEVGFLEKFKGQHAVLTGCIDQLTTVESLRANLVSHLREALQEQEFKLEQLRSQLQLAQSCSDEATNTFQKLLNSNNMPLIENNQVSKEAQAPAPNILPQGSFAADDGDQQPNNPVVYTRQVPSSFPGQSGGFTTTSASVASTAAMDGKSAAAAVAAKLTASTSSAQMLTYVLSSLAQEGVIGSGVQDSSLSNPSYPSEKKPKLENDPSSYVPLPPNTSQQVPPAFPHPSAANNNNQMGPAEQSSPPPSSSQAAALLPPIPFPVPPYMQTAGSMPNMPYPYGGAPQQMPPPPTLLPMPGYTPIGGPPPSSGTVQFQPPPPPPIPGFQGNEGNGGFYGQKPPLPMAPISRQ